MIWLKELCTPTEWDMMPIDHRLHLTALHHKMNVLRAHYGRPMIVTSGYRSMERHQAIYAKLNESRVHEGLDPLRIPLGSAHLIGAACDISDSNGQLKDWVRKNLDCIEKIDLFIEAFEWTPHHVHFQLYSPRSGNRFFKP